MEVTLTEEDIEKAIEVGSERNRRANMRRYSHRAAIVGNDNAEANHILGVKGEIAFAKMIGLKNFEPTIDTYRRFPDLPGDIEVRTRRGLMAELIIRDLDKDDSRYVLVTTADEKTFEARGWIFAKDGKRPEYESNPGGRRPAFFVPQTELKKLNFSKVKSA